MASRRDRSKGLIILDSVDRRLNSAFPEFLQIGHHLRIIGLMPAIVLERGVKTAIWCGDAGIPARVSAGVGERS
jgi:hypothetical protein